MAVMKSFMTAMLGLRGPFFIAVVLGCSSLARANDVWTVDASGTADFSDIQSAVDVAADNDVILVMPGTYFGGVTITAKSVRVIASGPRPEIRGTMRVIGLSSSRSVLISGFDVFGDTGPADDPALRLSSNDGAIRVQDCLLTGANGSGQNGGGGAGVEITASQDVVFSDCLFVGGEGFYAWIPDPYDPSFGWELRVNGYDGLSIV